MEMHLQQIATTSIENIAYSGTQVHFAYVGVPWFNYKAQLSSRSE